MASQCCAPAKPPPAERFAPPCPQGEDDDDRQTVSPSDGSTSAAVVSPHRASVPSPLRPLRPQLWAAPDAIPHTVLVDPAVLDCLDAAVPRRFGGAAGASWHLLFCTATDGVSLAHMLRTVSSEDAPRLVIVRESSGRIFGAYASELREPAAAAASAHHHHPLDRMALVELSGAPSACAMAATTSSGGSSAASSGFYGTGETFLFALAELSLPLPPERQLSSPSPCSAQRGRVRLCAYTYRWGRGHNTHFIRSERERLVFGTGGVGGVGLAIDANLRFGTSGASDTFANAPLPSVATPVAMERRSEPQHAPPSQTSAGGDGRGSGGSCQCYQHSPPPASPPSTNASPSPPRRTPLAALQQPQPQARPSDAPAQAVVDSSQAMRLPARPPAEPQAVSPIARTAAMVHTPGGVGGQRAEAVPLDGHAKEFAIATLEVWAVDERSVRGLRACASHVCVDIRGH